MKQALSLISMILSSLISFSQTPLSGDINGHIAGIISAMPGSSGNNYSSPGAMEESDWEDMITNILDQDYATAAMEATAFGYTLYAFTDNTGVDDKLYYLLEEDSPQSRYWGTYVFNPDACRQNLIIQSPHPKYDFNTGKQGIHVLHEIDAAVFMMSGTHRCNHSSMTSCSGTTQVCNDMDMDEKFRLSDLPHSDNSVYQATTRVLLSTVSGAVFVQLHGFTKLASDPYVIMSNGTDQAPTPPDYALLLRDNLLAEDATLTFKIPHVDIGWDRLVGFTNTQGRWINGEADPCFSSPIGTSGQFIHMEQEKTKLRADVTGWDKVANALASTFSCSLLPVDLLSFDWTKYQDYYSLQWEVAQEINLSHYKIQLRNGVNDFKDIGSVIANGASHYQFPVTPQHEGSYYYRLKMVDIDGSFKYSDIISIKELSEPLKWVVYPNPFEQEINVKVGQEGEYYVRFYNHLGQAISSFYKFEQDFRLNVPSIHSNSCWLGLYDNDFNLVGKSYLVRFP